MQKDAQSYVNAYDKCQYFSNIIGKPTEELTLMSATWPFAQWGLDLVGPFPIAIWQLKFLVVGIDYFTKWVKAKPLGTITEKNVLNFIWKRIICHFGIPGSSSLTMESNLIMTHLEIFANSWGPRIITPLLLTPRPTDRLKSQIAPCSR